MAQGESGRFYVGVNVELPGLPLHASVHAEQCLITNMLLNEERSAHAIAISEAPCGHCRQFMSELCCAVRPARLRVLCMDHIAHMAIT